MDINTQKSKNNLINIIGIESYSVLKAEIKLSRKNILITEAIIDNGDCQLAFAESDAEIFLVNNIFRYGKFTNIFLVASIRTDSVNNFKNRKIGVESLYDDAIEFFTGIPFCYKEKLLIGSLIPIDKNVIPEEWMPKCSDHAKGELTARTEEPAISDILKNYRYESDMDSKTKMATSINGEI